jgi:hypothetical protein
MRLHGQRLTTSSILRSLHVCRRTFNVETKSAVSSRVNWLIWSTIVAILGFAGAAAASDCHLRCILCCAPPTAGRTPIAGRAVQMQRLRARDAGADMLCGVESAVDGMDGSRRVVLSLDFADGNAPFAVWRLGKKVQGPEPTLQKSSRLNSNATTCHDLLLYESVGIMGRRPEIKIQHSYRRVKR